MRGLNEFINEGLSVSEKAARESLIKVLDMIEEKDSDKERKLLIDRLLGLLSDGDIEGKIKKKYSKKEITKDNVRKIALDIWKNLKFGPGREMEAISFYSGPEWLDLGWKK